jgi:hypothetical protein
LPIGSRITISRSTSSCLVMALKRPARAAIASSCLYRNCLFVQYYNPYVTSCLSTPTTNQHVFVLSPDITSPSHPAHTFFPPSSSTPGPSLRPWHPR